MKALAKVFIKGPEFYGLTAEVFQEQGKYVVTDNLKNSDIVVLTGGEDINPKLYGEKAIPYTQFSNRDQRDLDAVSDGYELGKFLVGICRGAQLLNVIPNGGKLWQDVNKHGGCLHPIYDCISGNWKVINSVHHQALRVTEEAEILAWAQMSTIKRAEKDKWTISDAYKSEADKDIEAVWYPKTRSFCFQAHPEFGHPPTTKYFFDLMDRLYWGKVA